MDYPQIRMMGQQFAILVFGLICLGLSVYFFRVYSRIAKRLCFILACCFLVLAISLLSILALGSLKGAAFAFR
ncbi:MAG TPA: hypothetical protein VF719_08165 [Abditibacteriaceae bacterium]|jgi:lipopolysaccharide export LptBFGC system permease protein LptF